MCPYTREVSSLERRPLRGVPLYTHSHNHPALHCIYTLPVTLLGILHSAEVQSGHTPSQIGLHVTLVQGQGCVTVLFNCRISVCTPVCDSIQLHVYTCTCKTSYSIIEDYIANTHVHEQSLIYNTLYTTLQSTGKEMNKKRQL